VIGYTYGLYTRGIMNQLNVTIRMKGDIRYGFVGQRSFVYAVITAATWAGPGGRTILLQLMGSKR
jgi:hypothetical protein